MDSAAGADPTALGLGLRSGSAAAGAWGGGGGVAAPAVNGAHEPGVDLATHPSGFVPTLQ